MKEYILMAVAGMLALSSCSNDDNEQTTQNAPRQMTFTAGFGEDATTRATLNDDKSVYFDYGDDISILSASNNNVYFRTYDEAATATFSGTAVAGDPTYYAVYPYDSNLALDGDVIKMQDGGVFPLRTRGRTELLRAFSQYQFSRLKGGRP